MAPQIQLSSQDQHWDILKQMGAIKNANDTCAWTPLRVLVGNVCSLIQTLPSPCHPMPRPPVGVFPTAGFWFWFPFSSPGDPGRICLFLPYCILLFQFCLGWSCGGGPLFYDATVYDLLLGWTYFSPLVRWYFPCGSQIFRPTNYNVFFPDTRLKPQS